MTTQSSMHFYVNWAKERLDEMDATLASLEGQAGKLQADARAGAELALTEIRNQRDNYKRIIDNQKEATEANWIATKATLESDWKAFEASVQSFVDAAGEHIGAREAAFSAAVNAQVKAWQDAADRLRNAATGFASDRKAEVNSIVKRMKDDADAAQAKLDKLRSAGTKSWTALNTALGETRASFDRANQVAQDAFNRAR